METANSKDAPLGVILISFFWILIGVWFLIMMQSFFGYDNPLIFIFIFLGTFFVFLGWGLLSLKKWAWTSSLLVSILGLFPMVTIILFLPIILYLMKKQNLFFRDENRYCSICGRNTPYNAKICPYCAKNLDELTVKDDINAIKKS